MLFSDDANPPINGSLRKGVVYMSKQGWKRKRNQVLKLSFSKLRNNFYTQFRKINVFFYICKRAINVALI